MVKMGGGRRRPRRRLISLRGQARFDWQWGIDLPPERRRLGYVFQEGRLFPHLSVRHNLLYGFRRAPAAERPLGLERVIALLGIEPLLERRPGSRSEEHTSELQSLMRISYAVFCLQKKKH